MEEVLKKHNLRFEIENEKNEGFLIQSKNTIFLEFDLIVNNNSNKGIAQLRFCAISGATPSNCTKPFTLVAM
jgi:hypothetical protein